MINGRVWVGFCSPTLPTSMMGLKTEATWSPKTFPERHMESKWSQIRAQSLCDMLNIGTPSRRDANFAINLFCALQRIGGRLSGQFGFVLGSFRGVCPTRGRMLGGSVRKYEDNRACLGWVLQSATAHEP